MKTNNMEQLCNYVILFAEDEKGLQEEIQDILEHLFKKVYVANNGLEARELYQKFKPDIILTDIKMPKLSGLEFVKEIRKTDDETFIGIISAHTDLDLVLLATELNLLKYIVKPITRSKLNEVFKKFLEKKVLKYNINLCKDFIFDKNQKVIKNNDIVYLLTRKEAKFLELLLSKKSIVTYEEIEYILELEDFYSQHALRQFIKKIRRKLPSRFLRNIQSQGYIISNNLQ